MTFIFSQCCSDMLMTRQMPRMLIGGDAVPLHCVYLNTLILFKISLRPPNTWFALGHQKPHYYTPFGVCVLLCLGHIIHLHINKFADQCVPKLSSIFRSVFLYLMPTSHQYMASRLRHLHQHGCLGSCLMADQV